MEFILKVIWFLLPSGAANMSPVFAARLFPTWDTPVDGGIHYHRQPLFGGHKTVRGILAGLSVSVLVFICQREAYGFSPFREISLFNYEKYSWTLGVLFGVGALGGDLVKSFVKRRMGKSPGASWFPFDQIDWMIGTLVVTAPLISLDMNFMIGLILLALVLSLMAKWIGYLVKLNESPI